MEGRHIIYMLELMCVDAASADVGARIATDFTEMQIDCHSKRVQTIICFA